MGGCLFGGDRGTLPSQNITCVSIGVVKNNRHSSGVRGCFCVPGERGMSRLKRTVAFHIRARRRRSRLGGRFSLESE